MLNYVAWRSKLLSDRLEFNQCNSDIFLYQDCFETIRVLTKFIKPKYLCDIGAHNGSWTYVMSQMNRELKHAVLFEPQTKCVQRLNDMVLPGVRKDIYPCGLGSEEALSAIKGGTASASFLDASQLQCRYFPNSISSENEAASLRVLDRIYAEDKLPYPDVIKLDVQGFELNVLRGAVNVLAHAKYLVIELSMREFYQGQPPLWEVLQFLWQNNYSMVGRGFEWISDGNPSEILQFDGIFMRSSADRP